MSGTTTTSTGASLTSQLVARFPTRYSRALPFLDTSPRRLNRCRHAVSKARHTRRSASTAALAEPAPPTVPNCTTPNGGKACYYRALSCALSGYQAPCVKRMVSTLIISAVPDTVQRRDTITFRPSSTDLKTASVGEWIWSDTEGATRSTGCLGLAPVRRFAPRKSGVMYVPLTRRRRRLFAPMGWWASATSPMRCSSGTGAAG